MSFTKKILFLLLFTLSVFSKDTLTVAIDYASSPLSYRDFESKPEGLFIEFWKLWSKKSGYDIKFKFYDKYSGIEAVKNGEAIFYYGLTPYQEWMSQSKTFYKLKNQFYKLKNKNLSLELHIGYVDLGILETIKNIYPKAKVLKFENYSNLVMALINGKINLIIGKEIIIDPVLLQKGIILKLEKSNNSFYSNIKVITNQKNREFIKIFDKYKQEISIPEFIDIERSILGKNRGYYDSKLHNIKEFLTKKEKIWLAKNQPIKYVYDPNREPFEYTNDLGVHSGIDAEILNLISKKSSIKFESIKTKNWEESTKLINEKKADMFSLVIENSERKAYMDFTKRTLYKVPVVFVTNKNDNHIYENIEFELKNKKIGIVKGRAIYETLLKKYPHFNFIELNNIKDGFNKVSNGKLDMLAVNKSTAKYYIKIKGYNDTKIATSTDIFFNYKMALQKYLPTEVLSIINKSLDSITNEELNEIYNKYATINMEKKINWIFIFEVSGVILVVFILLLLNNKKLKSMVKAKTKKMQTLLDEFDKNVMATRTDKQGKVVYASKAFCDVCGYTESELLGKKHGFMKHPDMPQDIYDDMLKSMKSGVVWKGEVKNLKKNGEPYWVYAILSPEFDEKGNIVGFNTIRQDITAQKKVEDLTKNLENKIIERTSELEEERGFIDTLLNSQEQIIITTDGKSIRTANSSFLKFYNINSLDEFKQDCICDDFDKNSPKDYLQKMMGNMSWIDYIIANPKIVHKAKISINDRTEIFSVTASELPIKEKLKAAIFTNITLLENAKVEIEEIHKHIKESIDYTFLIQHSLIPKCEAFAKYFDDFFAIWEPKDTIGGDIYLFEELRNEDECLLMVIDCTGHGVPGAFVTMLVKALERQIVSKIKHSNDEVSPAQILSIFNKNLKQLLKQDDSKSISNVGFDGSIVYYNKKDKIIKFAGAQNPLFYIHNNELKIIKGCRESVGYRRCKMNTNYSEYIINIEKGMQFYLITDGYIDQNGGVKGFPFGKKRFQNIIKETYKQNMQKQKNIFIKSLDEYQGNEERNDDITMIGFKI